ncbi:MAG: AraC family transcriptional regulator [Betaproteobacteria bacterium]|nr:AraC family transcriptional regulator [Betaproteobacteria bacterium]
MTDKFAETTEIARVSSAIDEALRSLRVSGSLLLNERYSLPWAVNVPAAEELRSMLGCARDVRVAAFHLVEFGHCEIRPQGSEGVLLKAGDMAICFDGAAHRVGAGKATSARTFASLLENRDKAAQSRDPDAAETTLLCGVFLLRHTELNPLLHALPPLLRSTLSRSGALHNLAGVGRLLADEVSRSTAGSGYVVERLLEVLCAEAIRSHAEAITKHDSGWFRGIKDPVVGRAIAAIHGEPGKNWTVPALASVVAMSPSRFSARFSASLGDSPMAYVAKWRMNIACRKLATTRDAVDRIAADLGYESHAAFNRAFKKLVGLPPAAWRARTVG